MSDSRYKNNQASYRSRKTVSSHTLKSSKISNKSTAIISKKEQQHQHLQDSIQNLEDPKFINKQIEQFEKSLVKRCCEGKGFSKMARQKSILLCTTQGYRKYKKQNKGDGKWRLNESCSYGECKQNYGDRQKVKDQ